MSKRWKAFKRSSGVLLVCASCGRPQTGAVKVNNGKDTRCVCRVKKREEPVNAKNLFLLPWRELLTLLRIAKENGYKTDALNIRAEMESRR